MSILKELTFNKPKTIGIFGNDKKEKFLSLLKIYNKIKDINQVIFISFNFNEELNNYMNLTKIKKINFLDKNVLINHKASVEEQEETFLNLFQLILKSKIEEHYYIFIDDTIINEKLLSLLKITKLKNISVIYTSSNISKELFLLTDEKIYGKTLSPSGIKLISNKTGLSEDKIKELKDNEYIYKEIGGNIIISHL
jgi:hypothetical protein